MKIRDLERFAAKVSVKSNGCWEWVGAISTSGYGRIVFQGKVRQAHRLLFLTIHGTTGSGLEIDHLCRNRPCVNPRHLELVEAGENTRRGNSVWGINSRKTHCWRGHKFDAANTLLRIHSRRGIAWRSCRTCEAIRNSSEYKKARAA